MAEEEIRDFPDISEILRANLIESLRDSGIDPDTVESVAEDLIAEARRRGAEIREARTER